MKTYCLFPTRTCKDSCTYLRGGLQVRASEMGKIGTEIISPISPILDKRKGGKPHHTDYYSPQGMSAEPVFPPSVSVQSQSVFYALFVSSCFFLKNSMPVKQDRTEKNW